MFSFIVIREKFDLENRKYLDYYGFLGIKIGKWKEIPKTDYVTVFPERSVQGKNLMSISSHHAETYYKIDLIISRTKRINAGQVYDKKAALEKGKEIAKALNVRLLDYTTEESKWVEV